MDLTFIIPAGIAATMSSVYLVVRKFFDDDDDIINPETGKVIGHRIKPSKKSKKKNRKDSNRV